MAIRSQIDLEDAVASTALRIKIDRARVRRSAHLERPMPVRMTKSIWPSWMMATHR